MKKYFLPLSSFATKSFKLVNRLTQLNGHDLMTHVGIVLHAAMPVRRVTPPLFVILGGVERRQRERPISKGQINLYGTLCDQMHLRGGVRE